MITIDQQVPGWSSAAGRFWTPAKHLDTLPSGIYQVGASQRIGTYLQTLKPMHDELLDMPSLGTAAILGEIQTFWDKADLFKQLGFVHKRGILLHGEPGCGKTSIMHQLIDQIVNKIGGAVLLGGLGEIDAGLKLIREREPNRPILVPLEDVDSMLSGGGEQYLLNLLDGANQVGGVVYLATTNYINKLPPRLISRPSRFDLIREIGHPDATDIERYVRFVSPAQVSDDAVKAIAGYIGDLPMSFVKEMVILVAAYGYTPETARQRLDEIRSNKMSPQTEVKLASGFKPSKAMADVLVD